MRKREAAETPGLPQDEPAEEAASESLPELLNGFLHSKALQHASTYLARRSATSVVGSFHCFVFSTLDVIYTHAFHYQAFQRTGSYRLDQAEMGKRDALLPNIKRMSS